MTARTTRMLDALQTDERCACNRPGGRATHLISAGDHAALPARLRMNAIANPGVPKADFEP